MTQLAIALGVLGLEEQPGVAHHLGQAAAAIAREHGDAAGHGLDGRQSEPFPERREDERVRRVQKLREVRIARRNR